MICLHCGFSSCISSYKNNASTVPYLYDPSRGRIRKVCGCYQSEHLHISIDGFAVLEAVIGRGSSEQFRSLSASGLYVLIDTLV